MVAASQPHSGAALKDIGEGRAFLRAVVRAVPLDFHLVWKEWPERIQMPEPWPVAQLAGRGLVQVCAWMYGVGHGV